MSIRQHTSAHSLVPLGTHGFRACFRHNLHHIHSKKDMTKHNKDRNKNDVFFGGQAVGLTDGVMRAVSRADVSGIINILKIPLFLQAKEFPRCQHTSYDRGSLSSRSRENTCRSYVSKGVRGVGRHEKVSRKKKSPGSLTVRFESGMDP